MIMSETAKSQAQTADSAEEKVEKETPPSMSGKLPSPYTAMRQKSDSSSQREQRNCDIDYARHDFFALVNRAAGTSATRLAQAKK
jgi:hypothetical protein